MKLRMLLLVAATLAGCSATHPLAVAHKRLGTGDRLRLGAIADVNGDMASLAQIIDRFRGRVDAVAALGGVGDNEEEIATGLIAIGKAGVPVLALASEREPEAVFHAGVVKARSAGAEVVDLVSNRVVDIGRYDIVAVPGYPGSPTGCAYATADLQAARDIVRQRNRPLILLSHMAPKGNGPNAVDWERDHNGGDPALLDLINATYPNAALFAHADDAGGRSERTWINVGGVARGMATVVDFVNRLPEAHVIAVTPRKID